MQIQEILDSRFQRVTPKSDAQREAQNRADAIIEICKFLHYAEVAHFLAHLEPHEMISLMDYAKKHGDKPKAFFKYLVEERKKGKV